MDLMQLCAAVLLILVLLRAVLSRGRRNRVDEGGGNKAKVPKGSLGWPLVGETLHFVCAAYSSRPESFALLRRLRYGEVFKSRLFGERTIVITDPEVSRIVLHSDSRSFVPWYPASLTKLMGESSILNINGPQHRRLHGFVASFFKSPALKAQVTAHMHRLLQQSLSPPTPPHGHLVHIQHLAKAMVFEILVRGLTGMEAGTEMTFLRQHFQLFISGIMAFPVSLPGTRLYRSLQAKRRMATVISGIVEEKRRRQRKGQLQGAPSDLAEVFLGSGAAGELSNELITDNIIDLMIPAEDSVPALITLAVHYLSSCPHALKQLREENVELSCAAKEEGREMEWRDYMTALPFTQQVITESLRMGNIISGVMRKAVRDVEVKGHLIPEGWCVFLYFRSLHLDHALHADPYSFNPWRWSDVQAVDEDDERRTLGMRPTKMVGCSNYWSPFGGGQRLCPGVDLARLQAAIFLHHLVTNFHWTLHQDHILHFPTVRLSRGLPITIRPLHSS